MEKLRAVKGMNDILPEEAPRWRRLEETFREICARYAYGEVRTPVLESTALFSRGIGEATDIVEKEMYSFVDKGDDALTLRPDGLRPAWEADLVGPTPRERLHFDSLPALIRYLARLDPHLPPLRGIR